jgi:hypothetical protein
MRFPMPVRLVIFRPLLGAGFGQWPSFPDSALSDRCTHKIVASTIKEPNQILFPCEHDKRGRRTAGWIRAIQTDTNQYRHCLAM